MMIARLALLVLFALAAVTAQAAEPSFPPGSRLGLVPPDGLAPFGNFRGFVDRERNASIVLVEMPARAFTEIDKTMTSAALKKQGVTQEKRETLTLKNGKAILIMGRQQADGTKFRKWIMVVEAPDMTGLVTVQIPDTAKTVYPDDKMRTALATVISRAIVPIEEQLGMLPFRIDDLAGFRAIRVAGASAVLLTEGPKDEFDAVEQPHVIVAASPGGPDQPEQRDMFARNFLGNLAGFKDIRVTGAEMLRLSGQQVHQIMADAKDVKNDKDVKLVQWMRFGSGGFLQVVGIAPVDGWTDMFPRFRTVRDNITPKGADR